MKKFKYLIALAVAFVGFTSCEDDKEPVYHEPTEFILNIPALANQLYALENGMTVELTCSQPDYGYSAITNYGIDISLTEEFTVNEEDGTENFYHISVGKLARMEVKAEDLATAICTLNGITDYANYPEEGLPTAPVYIRATANLTGVESSAIVSNTICLQYVSPFNPYREGGRVIYILGDGTGWDINNPSVLKETAIGSNVYVGAFNIPAKTDGSNFRFYTKTGNWGEGSIGSSADGSVNQPVTLTKSEPTEYTAVDGGQGNWQLPLDWAGGVVTFTVDLNAQDTENPAASKITFTIQEGNYDITKMKFIYVVGDAFGWSVDSPNAEDIYANCKLYDYDDNGVYMGIFTIQKGKAQFRFYTELGSWDNGSIGAGDSDTELQMNEDSATGIFSYSGQYVDAKGNWKFTNWPGGKMKMIVDTNSKHVDFTSIPASE